MSRGLTAPQVAQVTGLFHPIVMMWISWPGPVDVHAHSGRGTIAWGGNDWLGVGPFGGVRLPEETLGLAAMGAEFSLHGLPADLLALIDGPIRNRPAKFWLGTTTKPGGNVLVSQPIEQFAGYVNGAKDEVVRVGKDVSYAIRIQLGVGPSARVGARVTHSYEDQIDAYPGDTAGRHLVRIRDKALRQTWPEEDGGLFG